MEKENEKHNVIVQTYAEDMVKVLEDSKGDLIKKIIHSEEQHKAERKNLSPESKKNKFFMFLGILLISVALVTLFFMFFKREIPTVPVAKQFVPIIFNDKSTLIEVAGLKKIGIEEKVLNAVNGTLVKNGGVEGIYLTINKSPVGLRKFVEMINGNFIVGDKSFVDDNFLMGIVNDKSIPALANASVGKDFFILLKMRSVSDVFDAMRLWENKMFFDLHGFFRINLSPETKYLLTKNFEDGIVENKNARILYDDENKVVMMYILADDNSVIITNTENATHEIILRLASSQIKK